jgi:hypothetical protein
MKINFLCGGVDRWWIGCRLLGQDLREKGRKWVVKMAVALVPRGFRYKNVSQYSYTLLPPLSTNLTTTHKELSIE